jgi:hypothetical protein
VPTSDAQGKDVALDWYRQIRPDLVVDIGPGDGTYARLMRPTDPPADAFDHLTARYPYIGPQTAHWIGIEAWAPYVERFGLGVLYDQVFVADARIVHWPRIASAGIYRRTDLVIAGDVLEHLAKPDARMLLDDLTASFRNLIVSVPVLHLPQGAWEGNPFERHVDHWTAEELRIYLAEKTGGRVLATWTGDVLTYAWWQRNAGEG